MSESEIIQNPKSKIQNGAAAVVSLLALSGCGVLKQGKRELTGTTAGTFAPASRQGSADAARRTS